MSSLVPHVLRLEAWLSVVPGIPIQHCLYAIHSSAAASDEEEDEQEASGSEASEEEPAASGSEASGSDEGSDEEAESGEGSDEEAGPEEESEEESEEEIDQTIYAPPKTAALPEEVTILEGDAEHGVAPVTAPSAAVGELLAAYNALRAFSWQLRLSPFSFPDFVAAMTSTQVGRGRLFACGQPPALWEGPGAL